MGASGSKLEEDKALQLCRERKKLVRQALDGRCSLAAAHVAYIESLKKTGTALRRFVEPEVPLVSSLYTSTNATPEPLALTEKSPSHFSFSSLSNSQHIDATEAFSPSPSPPSSSHFQVHHMKFRGFSSKKVEEKPPVSIIETVTSSSTPQNNTPRSIGKPESSPFEAPPLLPGTQPWDYFGLFHPVDHEFSFQGNGLNQGSENVDDVRRLREEEGIPDLEDEEKSSFNEKRDSRESDDEFDEPLMETLVRSFDNVNRVQVHKHDTASASSAMPIAGKIATEIESSNGEKEKRAPETESLNGEKGKIDPETEFLNEKKGKIDPETEFLNGKKGKIDPETEFLNGKKGNSPILSPLRPMPSSNSVPSDPNKAPVKEDCPENKVASKDFFSSMKDIEFLFVKASDAGKEVPRMLEANKLHFRAIVPGKENESVASMFLKACFSCGDDPSQVKEEPPQTSVKYLTWHRTMSSRSSSSGQPLELNSKDDVEELSNNLFENICKISGSHASTLDRLYAWERKLYDEVKASQIIRREYDSKCKTLRELESKGESSTRIDKIRAVMKDLHSRIRVAIHRIDSISKRIEELRDEELQPQLEELIEGLSRMWEVMSECHRLQYQIISAYNGSMKISMWSESRQLLADDLENDLSSLSSSFTKWIGAQKAYLQAIDNWLFKCIIQQKSSKRKRRSEPESLRRFGPPIYVTSGVWLDRLKKLPTKDVVDSIKSLAAETSHLLPRQEKNQGKNANHSYSKSWMTENTTDSAVNLLADNDASDLTSGFDRCIIGFLGQLNNFADASVKMYVELQKAIQDAKNRYRELSAHEARGNGDRLNSQT